MVSNKPFVLERQDFEHLHYLGFKRALSDFGLYFMDDIMGFVLYVDDFLISSRFPEKISMGKGFYPEEILRLRILDLPRSFSISTFTNIVGNHFESVWLHQRCSWKFEIEWVQLKLPCFCPVNLINYLIWKEIRLHYWSNRNWTFINLLLVSYTLLPQLDLISVTLSIWVDSLVLHLKFIWELPRGC